MKECYNTRDAKCSVSSYKKRRYKKIVKHKVKNSEDLNDIDSSCTNDESEDGESDASHNDQDSDVSFEIDDDEDIDAAEIEEEEWVEYIKRSTIKAMEKMGNEKIRCWNKTQSRSAVISGFHSETSEPEVIQLLKEFITEIGMTMENASVECAAKPITHASIHFKNDEERNKFVRSANMLKKESRGRKLKISRSMDADERFIKKGWSMTNIAFTRSMTLRIGH